MNIAEWLNHARTLLAESGCPDAEVDARWIAEDSLGMSWTSLRFEADQAVTPEQLSRLEERLHRRASGEPVQYILERADFMGLRFYVDRRVLIPRQDTETLVEAALIPLRALTEPGVLDLCAGSGCIGLSLKNLAPHSRVTLADASKDALEVARINAKALSVDVRLRCGDLFRVVGWERFDCIVSNPPYIPFAELSGLQREVQYEPTQALNGGADGLDFYRRITRDAGAHLNPGGRIYLEVGAGQAGDVLELLRKSLNCEDSGTIPDLNGIERVVWGRIGARSAVV